MGGDSRAEPEMLEQVKLEDMAKEKDTNYAI